MVAKPFFYQLGVDSRFRPSPEEARIAFSLEEGVIGVLLADNDDDDDVDDILDTLENHPLCVDPLRYFRYSVNTLRSFCEGCWPFRKAMVKSQSQVGRNMEYASIENVPIPSYSIHTSVQVPIPLWAKRRCPNSELDTAACVYQERVLRRDCITGRRLFPFF